MIIGSEPLYNMMAVVVLSVFKPGQSGLDRTVVKKTIKGIVTNPILIGIVAGLVWSALKIPMPAIPKKVISSIGNVATPMGLMAMGATFDIKNQTICHCCFYETYWSLCHFPANCSETWIPYR